MTPREEFEKLFEHVATEFLNSLFGYELDGNKYLALNLNLNPDEIWNWHISEMEKLLERVEAIIWSFSKYEISGNNGKYIDEELLKKVIQSLNKLKEEVGK